MSIHWYASFTKHIYDAIITVLALLFRWSFRGVIKEILMTFVLVFTETTKPMSQISEFDLRFPRILSHWVQRERLYYLGSHILLLPSRGCLVHTKRCGG